MLHIIKVWVLADKLGMDQCCDALEKIADDYLPSNSFDPTILDDARELLPELGAPGTAESRGRMFQALDESVAWGDRRQSPGAARSGPSQTWPSTCPTRPQNLFWE